MTATTKLFTVAGVSKTKNQYKVRFANDIMRVKILQKRGNTDIDLFELPKPMTKPEIAKYLKTTHLMDNPEYQLAIDTADAKYNPVPTLKVRKSRKPANPSMEKIRSRASYKDVSAEDIIDAVTT